MARLIVVLGVVGTTVLDVALRVVLGLEVLAARAG